MFHQRLLPTPIPGKVAWRFKTIALKGEPGGDSWNNLPDEFRQGAETWIAGTYDPELNTTYWGTAQSKPWTRASRESGAGATLYAHSTLALDPDGKLKWFYTHAPGENFDLDEVFERVLVDHGDAGRADHRQGWHSMEAQPRHRPV